jgi:hypothetical protein
MQLTMEQRGQRPMAVINELNVLALQPQECNANQPNPKRLYSYSLSVHPQSISVCYGLPSLLYID